MWTRLNQRFDPLQQIPLPRPERVDLFPMLRRPELLQAVDFALERCPLAFVPEPAGGTALRHREVAPVERARPAARTAEPQGAAEDACVVLIYPPGADMGRRFLLDRNEIVIGRGSDCDLQLDRDSVSRRHARIVRQEAGWMVQDLGSSNGTGRRAPGERTARHLSNVPAVRNPSPRSRCSRVTPRMPRQGQRHL